MTTDDKLDLILDQLAKQNKANSAFVEFVYGKLLAIEGLTAIQYMPKAEQSAEIVELKPLLDKVKKAEAKLLQVAEELKD